MKVNPHFSIDLVGQNVLVCKDFTTMNERGLIAHFITELELAKLELLEHFDNMENDNPCFI